MEKRKTINRNFYTHEHCYTTSLNRKRLVTEKGRFNSAYRGHKENGFERFSAARVFTRNVHSLHSETERQG